LLISHQHTQHLEGVIMTIAVTAEQEQVLLGFAHEFKFFTDEKFVEDDEQSFMDFIRQGTYSTDEWCNRKYANRFYVSVDGDRITGAQFTMDAPTSPFFTQERMDEVNAVLATLFA
jgi:hypothetical protein